MEILKLKQGVSRPGISSRRQRKKTALSCTLPLPQTASAKLREILSGLHRHHLSLPKRIEITFYFLANSFKNCSWVSPRIDNLTDQSCQNTRKSGDIPAREVAMPIRLVATKWSNRLLLSLFGLTVGWSLTGTTWAKDPVDYIDPFIGTGHQGKTFPGAANR
jgi:hypothetical protein